MTVWQVEFEIVPEAVLRAPSGALTPDLLAGRSWWEGVPLPSDYRTTLDGVAPRSGSWTPELETWGVEEGNRIEVRRNGAAVTRIVARVDVRRLDAKFGAALLVLVRYLGATLVRRDGMVLEPTIGAFGAALRGTPAWRHANDPATWLAAQPQDEDA